MPLLTSLAVMVLKLEEVHLTLKAMELAHPTLMGLFLSSSSSRIMPLPIFLTTTYLNNSTNSGRTLLTERRDSANSGLILNARTLSEVSMLPRLMSSKRSIPKPLN